MAKVLTRSDFYDLVWSKPMTHLAKDFGVSDAALHKVCKKHDIPKPPAGWWTRKALGQDLTTPPIPPAKPGCADRITIATGVGGIEPALIAAARERARAIASDDAENVPQIHPIVERTLAQLRKVKPLGIDTVATGGAGRIKAEVGPGSVDRLGHILNRLVSVASVHGFKLIASDTAAHFSDGIDTITFAVSEITDRASHVLTSAEEAKQAAWAARRDREMKINPWRTLEYERPKFPDWDYWLTGRLSIELEQVYVYGAMSPRRSFRDGKTQRLEDMTGSIAVGLAVLAAAKVAERARRVVEQQRQDEARQVREIAARAKHVEDRRVAAFKVMLGELQEVEHLRSQLELLERQIASAPTPRVSKLLEWSRQHLSEREARLTPASIEQLFDKERLFGENDDFGFRPAWNG